MSICVVPLSDAQLTNLLLVARNANAQKNITGLLLYSRCNVLQIIEGCKDDLYHLYDKILADTRHFGLVKVADKAIKTRSFTDWSMAFTPVEPELFESLRGYVFPDAVDLSILDMQKNDKLLLTTLKSFLYPVN